MLISHTLKYLPAQLLSPAAQLISVILWTHWLTPAEIGVFTLVGATQEIVFNISLGWFSLYALRYLPPAEDAEARRRYLSTENVVVLTSLLGAALAAAMAAWSLRDTPTRWLDGLVIGLFFATRALNTHYGERARAQSAFLAYNVLQIVGPVGGLALGLLALQYFDASARLLFVAYSCAQVLGTVLALPMLGMRWHLAKPDPVLLRAAVVFGAPMLGLGGLGWMAENYIRYLVQWQSGTAALGLMVIGWSLGRRCASVATMLVATAAFPLTSRLLNDGRRDEALAQLRINAAMLVGVLLPVTAALQLLGPELVRLTVAVEYQQTTSALLGLAMLAGTLRNLHIHVTDQLMVLELRLKVLALVAVVEILACVVFSLIGLRQYGLEGAVIGQAIGSTLALGFSMRWVRIRLGFPWPWRETFKIILAAAIMATAIVQLSADQGWRGLLLNIAVGSCSYALALLVIFARDLQRLRARLD
jgi:O-antigen/teichoic acid export membrane protein